VAAALPATLGRPADPEAAAPRELLRASRSQVAVAGAEGAAATAYPAAAPAMPPPPHGPYAGAPGTVEAHRAAATPEPVGDAGLFRPDAGLATLSPAPDAPGSASAPARPGAAGGDAPEARALASQLGEAFVSALPDGAVEISLRPEELGRVRMVLSPESGGLAVTLMAERPETLDQMRRAIDTLAADLRDLGYAGLSFRFDRSGHPGGRPGRPAEEGPTLPEAASVPVAERGLAGIASGLQVRTAARLDIRL
jgi:hypothetical protein